MDGEQACTVVTFPCWHAPDSCRCAKYAHMPTPMTDLPCKSSVLDETLSDSILCWYSADMQCTTGLAAGCQLQSNDQYVYGCQLGRGLLHYICQ